MLSRSHRIAEKSSVVYPIVGGFISNILILNNERVKVQSCSWMLLGVVVAESDTPEDHVEEEEDHEVDDSPQVVYLVSLHPVRVPARVLSEGVNLVSSLDRRLLTILTSALGEPQPRVDGLGLSTKQETILSGLQSGLQLVTFHLVGLF